MSNIGTFPDAFKVSMLLSITLTTLYTKLLAFRFLDESRIVCCLADVYIQTHTTFTTLHARHRKIARKVYYKDDLKSCLSSFFEIIKKNLLWRDKANC